MKILFVGLGSIGQRHLRNIRKLFGDRYQFLAYRSSQSNVPLLSEKMEPIADESVESRYGVKSFFSFQEALDQKPLITFICNPSNLHLKTTMKALAAGSHVFVEKPLVTSEAELLAIKSLTVPNGQIVYVGFQQRFHPCFRKVQELLGENDIGRVLRASFRHSEYMPFWHRYEDYRISYAGKASLGGGSTLTQIHELDFISKLFGRPTSVYALGGKWSDLEIDVEDTVCSLMSFSRGEHRFAVKVDLDYHSYPGEKWIEIQTTSHKIFADFSSLSVKCEKTQTGETEYFNFDGWERNQMFLDQTTHLFKVLAHQESPMVTWQDSINSAELSLVVKKAMLYGEKIEV